jgi:hypothetical protein
MAKKTTPPASVEDILEECTKAVKRGLGRKRAGRAAAEFWITRTTTKIEAQIKKGTNWELARKRVLPTAEKMGRVAAALTGALEIVPLWAAEAASVAVRNDPKCPNDPGSGGFCP